VNNSLENLISQFNLEPHPEGGYFRETYRSKVEIPKGILDGRFNGIRNCSTCIYFLLTSNNFSAFHKINQDEIWHFYDGSPIRLHIISECGVYTNQLIGIDIKNGQLPQFVVEGGSWFAAEVEYPDAFSFVGCTVAPGFSFDDFELGIQNELIKMFPKHKDVIEKLTRL
jgi:predicted cupin superfamily sugar epimerase